MVDVRDQTIHILRELREAIKALDDKVDRGFADTRSRMEASGKLTTARACRAATPLPKSRSVWSRWKIASPSSRRQPERT